MIQQKRKRSGEDGNNKKKKKVKKIAAVENADIPKAELLEIQNIRDGMLLLGCIIEIRSDCLVVSLPGCLVGKVPIANISKSYTKFLKNDPETEVLLENLFNVGSLYPCKVLKVIQYETKKPTVLLSINPSDVNSGINVRSLYNNMVLYAAVNSIEDRGYVMDVGIKHIKSFMSFNDANSDKLLSVGQVIPTCLKNVPNQKEEESVLSLAALNFEESFPEVSEQQVKLNSILPGACISGYISEVTKHFLYLKCLDFDACACLIYNPDASKKLEEAVTVTGRVLYVHPVTHLIYIHLGSLPTPESFQGFFNLRKFDRIRNIKFFASFHHKLYFKYQKAVAYVKKADVTEKTSLSYDALLKNPVVPKARVVFLHYMDNLIQLTFKEALLKMKIVRPEDVKVGDIYEALVTKHVEDGMFVSICPGLSGFVRHVFFSDSYITMPEKLHPVGETVKCRVLSIHPSLGLNLTCKESLLNIQPEDVVTRYEDARKGSVYKGVIVKKTDSYIIVLFFNNVKGIVSPEHIPNGSVFYEGQSVLCGVLYCFPKKKKLSLTLDCENFNLEKNDVKKRESSKSSNDTLTENIDVKDAIAYSFSQSLPKPKFVQGKPYNAYIKKVTAHQLNIVVEETALGRIHITQMDCLHENIMPFEEFVVGQQLIVYVLQEYEREKKNFLAITHQNYSSFLECSFIPKSLVKKLKLNKPLIGYVKKVFDGFAAIWLTPNHCGILDYVNISKSPKELRKMKKSLKLGQTIKVSILSITESSEEEDEQIRLTTPNTPVPTVGANVAGFVTLASVDKGIVAKLPHGYTGFVCLTDIQDEFMPIQGELEKLNKLKFILCHVIKMNQQKKTCVLSLRKSRLYADSTKIKSTCPEVTRDSIKQGQKVKGFVLCKSNSLMEVGIGRHVKGKLRFHKCEKLECAKCRKVSDNLKSLSVGDVIEVIIEEIRAKVILLSSPDIPKKDSAPESILHVTEDINWNEL